jgi:hypothetical protein
MGNKLKNKRMTARRAAGFLATLGLLAMSSGVALMVSATPANAADQVSVTFCHSTESESNPWEEITTNANAFYEGHVLQMHTDDVYPSVDFEHANKQIHVDAQGDQAFLANHCVAPTPVATASATPIQPTCADLDGGYTTAVSNAEFASLPAAVPGSTIHLTANAINGAEFAGGASTLDVPVTLDAAPTNCGSTVVSPPLVSTPNTPKSPKADTVTPTVVHAGLTGTTVQDVRGEQGLALMVGGMLMLAGAGGLRLRSGRASRI